jgi:SAM-dependent methyltransferase
MNPHTSQSIDVDTLMTRIRTEVARRKHATQIAEDGSSVHESIPFSAQILLNPLPSPQLPKPQFVPAERHHLNDFLALHDQDFIEAAYRGVLKRGVDVAGYEHFLRSLRNGTLSKIEILGRLRYSPEGKRQRVPVRGLLPAFAVQHAYRLPVVGGLIAFAMAFLRLPRIARNLQGLEGYQHQRNAELEFAIRNLALAGTGNGQKLIAEILRSEGGSREFLQRMEASLAEMNQRVEGSNSRIETALADWQAASVELNERNFSALDLWKEQVSKSQADARGRIENAEHRIVAFEARNEGQGNRIAAFEARNDAQESRITAFEARNEAQENRIEVFEARNEAQQSRIAAFESRNEAQEHRIALFEAHKQEIDRQLLDAIALSQQTSTQLAATLRQALGALEQRVEDLDKGVQGAQDRAQRSRQQLVERLARVEGRTHEHGLRLAQATLRANATAAETPSTAIQVASRFDQIYFAFEERFRGTRADIRQRLSYYLPLLRESVVGKDGAAVLDVGCGRGEWLELLRDEKIAARGIDINETMARECVELGLEVEVGDAIARLRDLPDNSLGAVTGFHIIEHVSLDTLIELIEQAHRVVQPGGLVIFETPNPENVVVGSCNFYIDPTHQRPLPPVLTQFLVEAGGFVDAAIHRVNAELLPQVFDEPGENDPPALRTALTYLRSAFLCAPDYSVVGHVA